MQSHRRHKVQPMRLSGPHETGGIINYRTHGRFGTFDGLLCRGLKTWLSKLKGGTVGGLFVRAVKQTPLDAQCESHVPLAHHL